MDRNVVDQVTGLAVVLGDRAVLVASDDVLAQVAPPGHRGLALLAHNRQLLLVGLLRLDVDLDLEHDDGAQVPHALLCHTQQLCAVLVELDAFDGRREVPCLEAFARLDVPEADCVVGRARGEDGAGGVDIDGPDGTLVAAICSEPLAVMRLPDADDLVLRDGEDEVAVGVVSAARVSRWNPNGPQVPSGTSGATNLIWVRARSWPANKMGLILAVLTVGRGCGCWTGYRSRFLLSLSAEEMQDISGGFVSASYCGARFSFRALLSSPE